MKRIMFPYLIMVLFFSVNSAFRFETKTQEIMAKVYHKLPVDGAQQQKIHALLDDIFQATPCQLYETIDLVMAQLQEFEKTTEQKQNKKIFFDHFVTREQINYLKNYKEKLYENFALSEKFSCVLSKKLSRFFCYIQKLFDKEVMCYPKELENLADRIVDYIHYERDHILSDYQTLLKFFVFTKNTQLPEIINFWSNLNLHHRLVRRVKSITPEVQVQLLADLFMLALQSYLMAGNGMYLVWLDENDADLFAKYTQKQQDIETNFQVYVTHLNTVQKNVVTQIVTSFKKSIEAIYDERKKANDQLQKEEIYLFKSINLNYPIQHALTWPPIPYDQIFEAGVMNTPKKYPWYNIYQNGDWQFDAHTNSFSQNYLQPFGISFWQKDFYSLQKPGQAATLVDPAQNNIFTEYISNEASYEIVVECTLYNCSYPFFVGIIFNRGRWISGDPERIWDYRLCGLYGTQPNISDPNTRAINLCYAQQIIDFENKKEKIISPLEQITTSQRTHLYSMPATDVALLAKDALTFVFTIQTSPTMVNLKLSQEGRELYSTALQVKLPVVLFHGIGFMAPGAQAEFKILKPEKLIYSPTDLKEVEG